MHESFKSLWYRLSAEVYLRCVQTWIDEGAGVIQRAIKRSGDMAEELMDDTTQRVKRHPIETIAATLAFGLVAGAFIGWMMNRR